jgi:hypothetical protein
VTVYRILSPTAILGYGFPDDSFDRAMALDLDLIAVDAGSMDAGPHYLGAQAPYVGAAALRHDLERLVRGALRQGCPLIVGSAGFSGGDPQLRATATLIEQIVEASAATDARMAVIPSGVDPERIVPLIGRLTPLGEMPDLTVNDVRASEIVAQMGMEPIAGALEAGAQIIVCGRAYDPAVFAADPIRRGYPAGIAMHAAKILECGAIACEPGSGSDCLVAELSRQGVATFRPMSPARRATVTSIAAHTLYEKPRPDLFHLPGGVLSIQESRFTAVDEATVAVEGSRFLPAPYSVKLEGCRRAGHRVVSLLPVTGVDGIEETLRVYGRNGVEETPAGSSIKEIGVLVAASSDEAETAADTAAFLRSTLLHHGYEGRVSTAGNLAFPFSPSDLHLPAIAGRSTSLFVAGSCDPVFQEQLPQIIVDTRAALEQQHPDLHAAADIVIEVADEQRPLAVVETVDVDAVRARERHRHDLARLERHVDTERIALRQIDVGDAYVWSVHHLLHDVDSIGQLFPIELKNFAQGRWEVGDTVKADVLATQVEAEPSLDSRSELHDGPQRSQGAKTLPLMELARVIRSKNAGINEITYDVLFRTQEAYTAALASGCFGPTPVARQLGMDPERVVGCYRYDPACAIKVTVRRRLLCGSPGDRDAFGAQQHARLLAMRIDPGAAR